MALFRQTIITKVNFQEISEKGEIDSTEHDTIVENWINEMVSDGYPVMLPALEMTSGDYLITVIYYQDKPSGLSIPTLKQV